MNKKVVFVISLLLLINTFSVSFAFTDINEHWAEKTISKFESYRIIEGYDDNTFKPDETMTRAEFITVINKILGVEKESAKYIPDITRDDWYYKEVRKAVRLGIIQGDDAGYVHPNDKITREEAAIILSRAFKIKSAYTIKTKAQDAYLISDWAKGEFYAVVNYGYITGYEDMTLRPQGNITRAEVVTIISRIIPNILTIDIYSGDLQGNTLVYDDSVVLSDLRIDGSLFISDAAIGTLIAKDVTVQQDMIVGNKQKSTLNDISVEGKIYEFTTGMEELITYKDDEYGISFTIPDSVVIKNAADENINYKTKDLIVISAEQDDKYYLQSIETIAKARANRYDNLYKVKESGQKANAKYILYCDDKNQNMIVIKRDNTVYELGFFNINSENLVDNIFSTMTLFETEKVVDAKESVYKNGKLALKFVYKDKYVVVDDSYNTGNINENDGFFKLFIQVNSITDMSNYTIDEIRYMLATIVGRDGEILETEQFKVFNNNAIKFKILAEDRKINSLYIIIGNNLYNLIFTGDIDAMNEVGETIFNGIINSLEF